MNFIEVKDPKEYDDFLKKNGAYFTQSSMYGDWHRNIGSKVYNYIVKDNEEVLAYIQFLEVKTSVGQSFLYAPYGPVLIDNNKTIEVLKELKKNLKRICRETKNSFFRLDFDTKIVDKYQKTLNKLFFKAPKYSQKGSLFQVRSEWVLDLIEDKDKILNNFNSKTRYSIRVAQKKEAKIKIVENNLQEYFDIFYKLMSETADRNNFNLHAKEYYKSVFKDVEDSKQGYLVVGEINGEISTISFMLSFNKTVTYLYGASDNKHRDVPLSHLAHWESIKHAKAKGFEKYNFGGISSKEFPDKALETLTRFKTRFGGQELIHSGLYDVVNKHAIYLLFLIKKYYDNLKKNMKNNREELNKKNSQKGFIRIIFLLVVILLIASLFGFTPEVVWDKLVSPIFNIMWKIAIWLANILKPFLNILINLVQLAVGLFERVF